MGFFPHFQLSVKVIVVAYSLQDVTINNLYWLFAIFLRFSHKEKQFMQSVLLQKPPACSLNLFYGGIMKLLLLSLNYSAASVLYCLYQC